MNLVKALDLSAYPRFVDRKTGAQIITENFFPVAARSLERWTVPVRHLNGKAVMATSDLLEEAQRRFDAAPVLVAKKIGGAA
ncbi:hypothetical protein [Pararhodobacter sp.]|uniref:hypothetical protein n=1 Tax=Pararhodobacter sp. TaxID=2127056 RepID=UPI002AFED216|nr:hypothetical protein [Pararhodobacter sp.]